MATDNSLTAAPATASVSATAETIAVDAASVVADRVSEPAGGEMLHSAEASSRRLKGPPTDALLAFISQGISSATNFLRLVFIVRVCADSQTDIVGVYALGMTIVMLMMALHERLVEASYTVFAHRDDPAAARSLLGNTALFSLAATGVASLAIVLAGVAVWLSGQAADMGAMLVVVGLSMPPIVMRELARSAAFTHFRMGTAIAIDLLTLVLQAALLAAFWAADGITVTSIYAAIALSAAGAVAGWLWAWRGDWSIDLATLRQQFGRTWNFSRWLLAARVMGNASRMIIPWVVFAILGKFEAGLLATCISLVGLAWLFVRGVNNYYRPYTVKAFCDDGAIGARRAVVTTSIVFTLLLCPICLLFGVGGDWLLVAVYGDKLAGAGTVVLVLALNTLVTSLAIAVGNGLMAIDRTRDTLWAEGLTLLATLIAAPGLVHAFGLVGAAWAMLVGNAVGAIVGGLLFERGLTARPPAELTSTSVAKTVEAPAHA